MSVLAVVPARLASTRLPRKPLQLLGGVPLIVRVAQRVLALGVADACVVATDSEEVRAVCQQAEIPCELTRPDHVSGTDRIAELVERDAYRHFETVVNVQGDEPFVSADAISAAVALVTSGRFPLGTAAVAASPAVLARPDVVKVVCADDGRALYFSRAPIPFLREPGDAEDSTLHNTLIRQHLGVYAYDRVALATWVGLPTHPLERVERLEQLRPLAHGLAMGVAVVTAEHLTGIDTEADLRHAEQLLTDADYHPSMRDRPVPTSSTLSTLS